MVIIRNETSVSDLKALGYKPELEGKNCWRYVCESKHARIRIGDKKRVRKENTETGELMSFTFKELEAAYELMSDYRYYLVDRARERIMNTPVHLNPCPKCGSTDVYYEGNYDGPLVYSGMAACRKCNTCFAAADYKERDYRTKDRIIKQWNKKSAE